MTPTTERHDLSLFGIKPELIELLEFREELIADPSLLGAEREESLQATEDRIREYVTAEIENANIALYLREFETREQVAMEESARQKLKAKAWSDRYERLKMLITAVMLQTGQKRIEGTGVTLSLRKCPVSVDVAQPNLVPSEFKRVEVRMNLALWGEIQAAAVMGRPIAKEAAAKILSDAKAYDPEPIKSDIGDVLKSQVQCDKCEGIGYVVVSPGETEGCNACGGTGKVTGAVPGCRLVSDKMTLLVK
jgi:hypothetical protein